jgi:hypothetical protein
MRRDRLAEAIQLRETGRARQDQAIVAYEQNRDHTLAQA